MESFEPLCISLIYCILKSNLHFVLLVWQKSSWIGMMRWLWLKVVKKTRNIFRYLVDSVPISGQRKNFPCCLGPPYPLKGFFRGIEHVTLCKLLSDPSKIRSQVRFREEKIYLGIRRDQGKVGNFFWSEIDTVPPKCRKIFRVFFTTLLKKMTASCLSKKFSARPIIKMLWSSLW